MAASATAARIASLQRRIAIYQRIIQRIRDRMTAMMDRTPESQNARIMAYMARVKDQVGHYEEIIAGYRREIEAVQLAGHSPVLLSRALRAVRRLNAELRTLGYLHRRGITGPRLVRQMARVAAARDALGAVLPVGGQTPPAPPLPGNPPAPNQPAGLFLLSRDPRDLAADPRFQTLFDAFSCDVPHGSPPTPDALPPTYSVLREFRTLSVLMPDGQSVEFWSFAPGGQDAQYPAQIVRMPQGVLFHGAHKPRKGTHTIHWHGIEPTAMNDGVGKLSFEVSGDYTYQWQATETGTYLYHGHHNTVLHVEFGMIGALVVDPPPPAGDPLAAQFNDLTRDPGGYPVGGPGYTLRAGTGVRNPNNDEVQRYDVEAIWVADDVDPRWHSMSHDQGLGCPFGDDAGLNVFEPKYFLLTGSPQGPTGFAAAVQVRAGQKLLLRLVCDAYSLQVNRFRPAGAGDVGLTPPAAGLPGSIIAMDGRALGHGPFVQYAQEIPLLPNEEFELTAARRFDILLEPGDQHVGDHLFRAEFFRYVAPEGQRGPKHVGALGVDGVNGLITVLPRA